MTADAIKTAEQRGYSRGYQAGKRRKSKELQREKWYREQQAFLDRAFLAAMPAAMNVEGWTFGAKPIRSTEDRIKLAAQWAREALKQRPIA